MTTPVAPVSRNEKRKLRPEIPPPPQKCSWPFFDVDFTVRIRPFIVMTKRIFTLDFASYCAHFGVSLCDETTCLTKFVALVRTTQRIETSQKSSDRTCHHHQRHHRNPIPIPYPYFLSLFLRAPPPSKLGIVFKQIRRIRRDRIEISSNPQYLRGFQTQNTPPKIFGVFFFYTVNFARSEN